MAPGNNDAENGAGLPSVAEAAEAIRKTIKPLLNPDQAKRLELSLSVSTFVEKTIEAAGVAIVGVRNTQAPAIRNGFDWMLLTAIFHMWAAANNALAELGTWPKVTLEDLKWAMRGFPVPEGPAVLIGPPKPDDEASASER